MSTGNIIFFQDCKIKYLSFAGRIKKTPNDIATSPEYKLHVDGDIYATGTVYGASGTSDTDRIESGGIVFKIFLYALL